MSVKHIGRFIYIAVAAVSVLASAGLAGCSSLSGCVKEAVQTETEKEEMVLWCYWDTPSHQKTLAALQPEVKYTRE